MKKHVTFFVIILFALIISCNSNEKKYTLKPNMKVGESYSLSYKMDIDQGMMGINNKMQMGMSYLLKVKSINAQKDTELDFMYDRMFINMKSGVVSISYDSDSTTNPVVTGVDEGPNAMQKMMENTYANSMGRMIGKSIQVTIDTAGEVKQVQGYTELINSFKDSINSMPGGTKDAISDIMGEDQVKQVFQQTFGTFPKKPVAIGEAWTNEINMNQNGLVMKSRNTYKIIEILEKENEAIIDFKGVMSMGMSVYKTTTKMDASGTVKGNLVVDLYSGLVKSGKQNMDIKMEMELMEKKFPRP